MNVSNVSNQPSIYLKFHQFDNVTMKVLKPFSNIPFWVPHLPLSFKLPIFFLCLLEWGLPCGYNMMSSPKCSFQETRAVRMMGS